MSDTLLNLIACPRCDKTPLKDGDTGLHCSACKVDFPALDGMPCLFAEPESSNESSQYCCFAA